MSEEKKTTEMNGQTPTQSSGYTSYIVIAVIAVVVVLVIVLAVVLLWPKKGSSNSVDESTTTLTSNTDVNVGSDGVTSAGQTAKPTISGQNVVNSAAPTAAIKSITTTRPTKKKKTPKWMSIKPQLDSTSNQAFNEECLKIHNKYRSLHEDTGPLTLHENLKKSAEFAALRMANISRLNTTFDHSWDLTENGNASVGESLYVSYSATRSHHPYRAYVPNLYKSITCKIPLKIWYDEIKYYTDYAHPKWAKGTHDYGHFTQLVWRESSLLGCAKSMSIYLSRVFVFCHYYKEGNIPYKFPANVKPLKKP